jgi:hypothetical protein
MAVGPAADHELSTVSLDLSTEKPGLSTDKPRLSTCGAQARGGTLRGMEPDDELADRLERIAEWHVGLRHSEQADLRQAATRLRSGSAASIPSVGASPVTQRVPVENGS